MRPAESNENSQPNRPSGLVGDDRLDQMIEALGRSRQEVLPSKYWTELNRRNVAQLRSSGYEHFKQTLALNYFTWMVGEGEGQLEYLRAHLTPSQCARAAERAEASADHPLLTDVQSFAYNLLTHLLWEYVSGRDTQDLLAALEEPLEGDPPRVHRDGKLISQDLANSFLEYRSVMDAVESPDAIRSIWELGAGYGRTAFVFLRLMPRVRYVIVDIPPALYVAERYLASQFPDRKIFRYTPFKSYEDVREEFESASIVFLMGDQIDMLPAKCMDAFLNISSLHEMRRDQIAYYFAAIGRLTLRYVYLKQWKVSRIPYDDLVVTEADYPVPPEWQRVYRRECPVQTRFFEALLRLPGRSAT